jgi:hypothetical protein
MRAFSVISHRDGWQWQKHVHISMQEARKSWQVGGGGSGPGSEIIFITIFF